MLVLPPPAFFQPAVALPGPDGGPTNSSLGLPAGHEGALHMQRQVCGGLCKPEAVHSSPASLGTPLEAVLTELQAGHAGHGAVPQDSGRRPSATGSGMGASGLHLLASACSAFSPAVPQSPQQTE